MKDNIKSLSQGLIDIGGSLSEITKAASEASEGLAGTLEIISSVIAELPNIKEAAHDVRETFKDMNLIIGDSEFIENFAKSVTTNVEKIGESFSGLSNRTTSVKKILGSFCDSGREKFSGLLQGVKKFGEGAKENFSTLKNTISNFSFSDLKEKIKNLPQTMSEAMGKLGNTLSTHAGSIGSTAGKLLSGGLIAGVALAAAALVGLVAAFKHLMESNEEFREKIETAWSKVTEAFEPVIEAFGRLKEALFGEDSGETPPLVDAILEGALNIIDCIAEAAELISEIVSGVFDFLTELWMEHGEAISEFISGTIETITEIISGIIDIVSGIIDVIVGFFTGDGNRISSGVSEMWDGVTAIFSAAWDVIKEIFSVVVDFFAGIWSGIKEAFASAAEWFGKIFRSAWKGISNAFEAAVDFFSGIWKGISKVFSSVSSYFKSKFSAAWTAVKNVFSGVGSFFSGIWSTIKKTFTNIGTSIGNAIGGAFKKVVNSIIGFAQNTINGFISAINGAIKLINKIPGVTIGLISKLNIPRLASGGLVDAGQMFVAREAGPELVGSFGSRAAVMNNDQIVTSVSKGVYEAVRAAMSGSDGNYTFHIVNKLDGREIGRQVVNYHNGIVKQTGASPLLV